MYNILRLGLPMGRQTIPANTFITGYTLQDCPATNISISPACCTIPLVLSSIPIGSHNGRKVTNIVAMYLK